MKLDADICYRAMLARDRRFDGLVYVGVTTTGVYCRPICPARTPGRGRCEFFARAAEAERAGFRACFRCRPELAPGLAPVDSVSRLVREAAWRIEAGFLNDRSVDELAAALHVSARHLRRAFEAELGASPLELAQTRRLALAKQLLHDTDLPLAQLAFAAGFSSVRRFNALFQRRFGRAPSSVRRQQASARTAHDSIGLRLDYRPPFDWEALLTFLAARAIPGVEHVSDGEYLRTVRLGERVGWVAVSQDGSRPALRAHVSISLAPVLMEVSARLRALFDLDAQPTVIAEHLAQQKLLAPLVRRRPGLRLPGAFDGFEMAVRAVLGQQVSVRAATTLSGRLAHEFGTEAALEVPGLERLFPSAERLASASVDRIRAVGMPERRARTIVELARAVAAGEVELCGQIEPEAAIERLMRVPGIGAWTAHYLAMRALRWPNAFPAGDLALCKLLGVKDARRAEQRAEPWQPWRAYAVIHLWAGLAQSTQGG